MIKKLDFAKIGKTLKKYREQSGMTRHEVADKVGVIDGTIYKYECGLVPMTVDKLRKFASVLNFRLEDIFGETSFDDKSLSVGQIVRTKRRALGLSKLELSKALGYTCDTSVKNIEKDEYNIPMNRMEDFCEVLGLSLADLIVGAKTELKKQYHWGTTYGPEDFSNKGEEMYNKILNKEVNAILNVNKDNYTVDLEFIDKSKSDIDVTEYIRYGSRLHVATLTEKDIHMPHDKNCICRICTALNNHGIKCDDIRMQIRNAVDLYLTILKENDIQSLTAKKKLVIEEVYRDIVTITVERRANMSYIIHITSKMQEEYCNGPMMSIGDICDFIAEDYGYDADNYKPDIVKFLDTIHNNFSNTDYEYSVSMTLNIK